MVKKGKSSSVDKKSIKTTLIVLFLFALAAGLFLFFNKDKDASHKRTATTSPSKVVRTKPVKTVKPTAASVTIKTPSKLSSLSKLPSGTAGKIAFVLDDWGYQMSNCHYLKEIKAPLAIAVLPNLRHTNDIMKCASVYDKDIMLHLPLEPYRTADQYPDYYLLTTKMAPAKVEALLDDTLKKMPLIIGVNNHMGSKATEYKPLMKLIYRKIKKKGLFFIDSMTAPNGSICGSLADEMNLPFAKRDVFLDNVNTKEAIEKQMVELAQKARRQGYAIAIGHDRSLTLQVIQESIPILKKQGFEIVHVKELLRNSK